MSGFPEQMGAAPDDDAYNKPFDGKVPTGGHTSGTENVTHLHGDGHEHSHTGQGGELTNVDGDVALPGEEGEAAQEGTTTTPGEPLPEIHDGTQGEVADPGDGIVKEGVELPADGTVHEHELNNGGTGEPIDPEPVNDDPEPITPDTTPEPPTSEQTSSEDDVQSDVIDDDPSDPLEEPVKGDDESDDEYAARRRSWSAKKAARTRAENKAAEQQ